MATAVIKNVLMDENEGLYIDLDDAWKRLNNIKFPEEQPEEEKKTYVVQTNCPLEVGDIAKFYAWRACYYKLQEDEGSLRNAREPYYIDAEISNESLASADSKDAFVTIGGSTTTVGKGYVYEGGFHSSNNYLIAEEDDRARKPYFYTRTDTDFILYTLVLPDTQVGVTSKDIKEITGYCITGPTDWKTSTQSVTAHYFEYYNAGTYFKDRNSIYINDKDFDPSALTVIKEEKIAVTPCGYKGEVWERNAKETRIAFSIAIKNWYYNGQSIDFRSDGTNEAGQYVITLKPSRVSGSQNVAATTSAVIQYFSKCNGKYTPSTNFINVNIVSTSSYATGYGYTNKNCTYTNVDFVNTSGQPLAVDLEPMIINGYDWVSAVVGTTVPEYYFLKTEDETIPTITLQNNFHSTNVALFAKDDQGNMCFLCYVTRTEDLPEQGQVFYNICSVITGSNFNEQNIDFTFTPYTHRFLNNNQAATLSDFSSFNCGTFRRDSSKDITTELGGYLYVEGLATNVSDGKVSTYTTDDLFEVYKYFTT